LARRALVLPSDQLALERFNDALEILLGPIPVRQQVLDAIPSGVAVILAVPSFIKEFAVLGAHIFLVLSAESNPHGSYSPPPTLGLPAARQGRNTQPKPKRTLRTLSFGASTVKALQQASSEATADSVDEENSP
jgi:hypothetical protein